MKLPINFLLYLTSIGLAGGSAYLFYETMRAPQPKAADIGATARDCIARGREQTPDDRRDDYSEAAKPWWEQFREANFTGKLPPKPEVAQPVVAQQAPPPSKTPIEELLDVMCVVFTAEAGSKAVVRYKESANVEPPVAVAKSAPGAYAGPQDTQANDTPRGRRAGRPQPGRPQPGRPRAQPGGAVPAFGGGDTGIYHHLAEGDSLWPPYEHIKLVRVEVVPIEALIFARMEPNAAGETVEGDEEKVFRNELQLDESVLEELGKASAAARLARAARQPDRPQTSAGTAEWVDVGAQTRAVKPGQWHISRQDNEMLARDAERIFHEDINFRSYSSRGGAKRGVQVTSVSPRMARFGIQAGDVLLELNGIPVRSKAEALSVGKKQYRAGTRSFRVKILNRYGQEEERTYYAPNE